MKNKIILSIVLIIFTIIGIGINKVYASSDTEYVYMYESTSPIYGGSEENKVKIPIPAGFTYKENGDGYISIHNKRNSKLVYIWVPLNNTSNKQELWKEVYEKYEEEKNEKIKKDSEFYKTIYNSTETLSDEFVNSIKQYKGFYVSEAELSYSEEEKFYNKARGMINSSVTNTEEKGDYYRGTKLTYNKIKDLAESVLKENNSVNSHLMYGVEWDAILIWISKTNTYYKDSQGNSISKVLVENSKYVGKYSDSNLVSSISELDTEYFNGIWGLGGNLAELTQEKYEGEYVIRGGSYNTTGGNSPIASKDTTKSIQKDEIGFRTALYITPNIEEKSWSLAVEEDTKYEEIEELENIDYSSIDEGKGGKGDADHLKKGVCSVKIWYGKGKYLWYKYYLQNQGPWKDNPYWGGTIASDGCGPTSIASMISAHKTYKKDWTPPTVIWYYQEMLKYTAGGDDYPVKLTKTLEGLGFSVSDRVWIYTDNEAAREQGVELAKYMRSGPYKTALNIQGPGDFTRSGHYMALIGASEDYNSFYVANPSSTSLGGYISVSLVMKNSTSVFKSQVY